MIPIYVVKKACRPSQWYCERFRAQHQIQNECEDRPVQTVRQNVNVVPVHVLATEIVSLEAVQQFCRPSAVPNMECRETRGRLSSHSAASPTQFSENARRFCHTLIMSKTHTYRLFADSYRRQNNQNYHCCRNLRAGTQR